MSVNRSFLQSPHPRVGPYEVAREKVREFATAIGAEDPAHHDVAAAAALGHADLVAPPTFAIVLTLGAEHDVVTHPASGVDYSFVVHREQRFVLHRPVLAGDVLTAEVFCDDVRELGGNDVIDSRTEVVDDTGAPVVTAYSVIVSRGTAVVSGSAVAP